jgi:signal transduction histidine kinase
MGPGVRLNLVADGWAEIVVSDQGPGIPENEIGRIFEEFYRAKGPVEKKGSGLGLAIAYPRFATLLNVSFNISALRC